MEVVGLLTPGTAPPKAQAQNMAVRVGVSQQDTRAIRPFRLTSPDLRDPVDNVHRLCGCEEKTRVGQRLATTRFRHPQRPPAQGFEFLNGLAHLRCRLELEVGRPHTERPQVQVIEGCHGYVLLTV